MDGNGVNGMKEVSMEGLGGKQGRHHNCHRG